MMSIELTPTAQHYLADVALVAGFLWSAVGGEERRQYFC